MFSSSFSAQVQAGNPDSVFPPPTPLFAPPHASVELQLATDFLNLFKNQKLTDATFVLDDEEIGAHKAILVARAEYFQSMFCGEMRESRNDSIRIENASPKTFRQMLTYLYSGNAGELTCAEWLDLLACSNMYLLEDLKRICEARIIRTLSNGSVLHVLRHARVYNANGLETLALDFIYKNRHDNVLKQCISSFQVDSAEDGKLVQSILSHWMAKDNVPREQTNPRGHFGFSEPSSSPPTFGGFGRSTFGS